MPLVSEAVSAVSHHFQATISLEGVSVWKTKPTVEPPCARAGKVGAGLSRQ